MDIYGLIATIVPSVVTIIAVIVPALVSIKTKKIESEEKEREWLTSNWSSIYFDFCAGFVEYQLHKDSGSTKILAESAYKLAAFCDNEDTYCFFSFADFVLMPEDFVDINTVKDLFNNCLKIIRANLIRKGAEPQEKNQSS